VNDTLASKNPKPMFAEAERLLRHYLSALTEYLDSPSVNEIMVNNTNSIFIEDAGVVKKIDVTLTQEAIEGAIQAVMTLNRKNSEPLMDARLKGMRFAAVLPPIAVHGALFSIRKLASKHQTLDSYLDRGDFTRVASALHEGGQNADERQKMESSAAFGGQGLVDFFRWIMQTRQDCAVVGGTSSGKTTLGGAMLDCIPDSHRIITCEDTNELTLRQENVVQLEANIAYDITLRKLIKMCLRLRPDRIIVGEVRGPELFDLLDAMNTGHPGALFTLHGNSAHEGLARMETLLRMSPEMSVASTRDLRAQIASSIDYVIFQGKRGKVRAPEVVLAVSDVLDQEDQYITRVVYQRQL